MMPLNFLKNALKDFAHVAALFPSTPFACRAIAGNLPDEPAVVVEYGPGSGVVTRELLRHLPPVGKLIAVEINSVFAEQLRRWPDRRLDVEEGDIVTASARLREWAPRGVDAVISGIPFSFLSAAKREEVVRNTSAALRPGGRFIVYQNSAKMTGPLERHFGRVTCRFEPRNVFPYFIMVGYKEPLGD